MSAARGVFLALIGSGLVMADDPARFVHTADGLVTDTSEGLIWMRCSLGQRFHEGRCDGEAAGVRLAEAEAYAEAQADAACPWRLPRFFEMRSLLQPGDAQGVAIDGEAFPDTPAGWYWNQASAGGHSQQDCFVDFTGNGRTRCNMAGEFHVRLVMDQDAAAADCRAP